MEEKTPKELAVMSDIERIVYDIKRFGKLWEIETTEEAKNAAKNYISHLIKLYVPESEKKKFLNQWENEIVKNCGIYQKY